MNVLPRYLRSPELRWLLVALIISVASLSSVSFLTDRMQRAFNRDAKQLIAADYLIYSDQPLPTIFKEQAIADGLRVANTVVFPTMASVGEQSKLVSLKAVSDSYPLRGVVKVTSQELDVVGVPQEGIPRPGTAWVDPSLLSVLNIHIGDLITLGQLKLKVAEIITQELDKGVGFLNFAPRVMIRADELDSTGLVGFGSRVTYKLLMAGDEEKLTLYMAWAQKEIDQLHLRGVKLEGVDNSQPFMRNTLDRAQKFLSLVGLLTAMVASVAMVLAARRYVRRQSDVVAIWKCLGASRGSILRAHFRELIWIGLLGTSIGSLIGWLGHQVLLWLLGDLLLANLPGASLWPMVWAGLVSLVLLLGLVWPPMMSLSNISPLRVLRKDLPLPGLSTWLLGVIGLVSFFVLLLFIAQDLKLALITLGGFLSAAGVFVLVSWAVIWGATWLAYRMVIHQDPVRRFTWQAISRRGFLTSIQIASLAIAMMALLLLAVVRQDLLTTWQTGVAVDAPNRFLINIQPEQKGDVDEALKHSGVDRVILYPMVRGRLTHINQQIVRPQDYPDEQSQRLIDREFNLSYGSVLPEKNRVVAGRWHGHTDRAEISIEQGIAKKLGLKLGDELQFDVAGAMVSARITSIRQLDWSSLRVNFFAILPEKMLADAPQTWITAYQQLPGNNPPVDTTLVARFPNITVVDVDSSLRQIRTILDKLSAAIELLFVFTVAAGLLVLGASLAASQQERLRDAALLKAMGARREQIARAFLMELAVIGCISGVMAAIGAFVVGWSLANFVFDIHLNFSWRLLIDGGVGGMVICVLAGWKMQRTIATVPVINILREL